ncbi:phasin family protein [Legionella impletisoli]|uniref:Phasin domain-containing protein n=1 Tax=Legionella impletisoli TaxID=343510 RepID=A0A917JVH2_9GAMM|nr:phasin family protein [Legionella impletisoli]GGI88768.1 hypothetical protein GCM10007966_16880 [Legionella impletisoli]
MNQEYFERVSNLAKKVQEPLKEMAELNIKTLQSFSYLKPEEITNVKKPEQLFEKQIELAVENGHKALDYMKQSFQIYEKAMLSFLEEAKKAEKAVKK